MAKFWEAVLILSGMIIGVGMFGIPFSFVESGFWLGAIELVILTVIVLLVHLVYGEIVLATPERHRVPGYVRFYLGGRAYILAVISTIFGVFGALLAYLLVGARFLATIFNGFWSPAFDVWVVIVAGLGAAVTLFPLRKEAAINGLLTSVLVIFIIALSLYLVPEINPSNLGGFHTENLFFPYGVLLFSLYGAVVVPEVISILGREKKRVNAAIITGSLIPAVVYFVFALGVVGVSGGGVSEEAIRGLIPIAGEGLVRFGSLIGFLAVFTSVVALGVSARFMLFLDLKIPEKISWGIVAAVPIFLYLLGFDDFIVVIGTVGAIGVGIDSALLIVSHHVMKKKEGVSVAPASYLWKLGLGVVIAAGVLYELYEFTVSLLS